MTSPAKERTELTCSPHQSGTNDYLVEAARADHPPSGTFYDPDHQGHVTRLARLGVYEHWNNATDKQYSRNLGTGQGIELIQLTRARQNKGAGGQANNRVQHEVRPHPSLPAMTLMTRR